MGSDCLGPNSAISATYLQCYHERSLSFTNLDLITCTMALMKVPCHRVTVRNSCDVECAWLAVSLSKRYLLLSEGLCLCSGKAETLAAM